MTVHEPPGDVLERWGSERGPGAGRRLRRGAVVIAVAAGVALLARDGLFSSDAGRQHPKAVISADEEGSAPLRSIVVRQGSAVVRYSADRADRVVSLPKGFRADQQVWAVDDAGSPPFLFGVRGGNLFRIDARNGRTVTDAGKVVRIVSVGPEPGQLVVQIGRADGSRVVILEAETTNVVDDNPFPAYDGSGGWTPRGTVTKLGIPGLALTRTRENRSDDFAIAWSELGVASGMVADRLEVFEEIGPLLGVADDWGWALFPGHDCEQAPCRLRVLSFTVPVEAGRINPVSPPAGWSFESGKTGGGSHEAFVPVVNSRGDHALARVVPGGDGALLLRDTVGFDPRAGLVTGAEGSVYFVRAEGTQRRVVARWSPVESPQVATFPELFPLPGDARLLCVCD